MLKIYPFALVLLFLFVPVGGDVQAQTSAAAPIPVVAKVEKFYRTELYFGRSKPDGSMIPDEEWRDFLSETVSPRFPDGFTVLKGIGQYREKSGRIITEPSEILVILYPSKAKKESRAKIEEIRSAYIKRFDQESVLRMDLPKRVNVSF